MTAPSDLLSRVAIAAGLACALALPGCGKPDVAEPRPFADIERVAYDRERSFAELDRIAKRFCEPDRLLPGVTREQCLAHVAEATPTCRAELHEQVPASLASRSTATELSKRYVRCALP